MKQKNNRRVFLRNLTIGTFSTVLVSGFFKPLKALYQISTFDPEGNQLPRINPAFMMNIYKDGRIEMYTQTNEGNKLIFKFEGLQADILVKLLHGADPELCYQESGVKYGLEKKEYDLSVKAILKSLEDKGLIYYGDLMKVKIVEIRNE